jgi:hypothetical protein
MDGCDPSNDSFYDSIDRHHAKNERNAYIRVQFKELCLQNNYEAKYSIKSLNGKFQCSMQIRDSQGIIIYHLKSDVLKSNEEEVLLNVMNKIISISKSIKSYDHNDVKADELVYP